MRICCRASNRKYRALPRLSPVVESRWVYQLRSKQAQALNSNLKRTNRNTFDTGKWSGYSQNFRAPTLAFDELSC